MGDGSRLENGRDHTLADSTPASSARQLATGNWQLATGLEWWHVGRCGATANRAESLEASCRFESCPLRSSSW